MTTRKPLVLIGGVPTALPTGDDIGLQPKSNLLTSVAALSTSADQLMYLTGTDTAALTSLSTFSRTQLANADATTWRTNLAVAALASPTFTGVPLVPTAAVNTNTTQIASTAFVLAQSATATPLINGTAAVGTATRFAREDHVHPVDTSRAATASPTFTGTPAAPTASTGTNTTQIATTAFVLAQITASAQPLHANLTSVAAIATNVTGLIKITNGVASVDSSAYLTANQSITFSGDATGTGTTAVTLTLANSGVTAGSYGGNITVDVKGRVTAISKGQLTLDTQSTTNASIELGAQGFTNTPFIDFHSGATLVDYDSRIIASGGNGSSGGGTLTYTAAAHTFNNRPTFNGNTAWDSGNLVISNYALLASPTFTGTPLAPTAADGTKSTQIATTDFVQNAVGGYLALAVTGGTTTLTDLQASNPVIAVTGALTANQIIVVPVTVKRLWAIANATSGAFTVTVKTASGTGVDVAQGKRNLVYTDGTNVYDGFNDFESIAMTGAPTAPTAATAVNSVQVATTAYVVSRIAQDSVAKAGGSTIGDGTAGAITLLSFYKNSTNLHIASPSIAGNYAEGATTGDFVIRNFGDSTTPKSLVLAGSTVQIGASATTAANFPTVATFAPTAITFTVRPTFNGNNAYDEGNLTPSNPPLQLSSTAVETQNTFWMEETENTGEGYISMSGNIGGITTGYDAGRVLFCKDSAGDLWYTTLIKV